MSNEARIADLSIKYIMGTLSSSEMDELQQWLNASPENKKIFEQYNNADLLGEEFTNRQNRRKRLTTRIETTIAAPANATPLRKGNFNLFKYAAAIVLIASAATLVWFNQPRQKQPTVAHQSTTNYIIPGGNKAILTLADGRQIILDSTANGTIAEQHGSKIEKRDGQLIYSNTHETAPAELRLNTMSTPRGGQYQLTLPDGSLVWLNAASSITFPTAFVGHQRNVSITGEVYFEVKQDQSKPFVVRSGNMDISVLGTHFNVSAYIDEAAISTTLLEGSVRVTKGGSHLLLKPGEQVAINNNGSMNLQKNIDIEEVMAWKNGYFSFANADLQSVMRQISRWYDVDVIYEGKIPEREFGGKIHRGSSIDQVLKVLEESNVHFRIDGRKIIVTP